MGPTLPNGYCGALFTVSPLEWGGREEKSLAIFCRALPLADITGAGGGCEELLWEREVEASSVLGTCSWELLVICSGTRLTTAGGLRSFWWTLPPSLTNQSLIGDFSRPDGLNRMKITLVILQSSYLRVSKMTGNENRRATGWSSSNYVMYELLLFRS